MTSTPDRHLPLARRPRRRVLRRRVLLPGAVVLALVLGALLPVFQPWRLVLDQQVDEAVPVSSAEVAATSAPAGAAVGALPGAAGTGSAPASAEPVVLATGELSSHEHVTTGSVRVLSLPDGSRVVRLADLDTSDGPALRARLTDAPVVEGRDGWHVVDDGRYAALTSLSIWRDRFHVSFGAAALALG